MDIIKKLRYIFNRRQKIKIIMLLFLLMTGAFLELMGVSAIFPFIDTIMQPEESLKKEGYLILYEFFHLKSVNGFLIIFSILLIVIYVIKDLFLILSLYVQNRFIYRGRLMLAGTLIERYLTKDYQYHANKNSAVLVRSLTDDVNRLFELINAVLSLCSEAAVSIFLGIFLFLTDWQISLVVVALLLSCLIGFRMILKKRMLEYGINTQKSHGRMIQNINEALGGIKEIKIKRTEQYFVDEYKRAGLEYTENLRKQMTVSQIPRFAMETVCVGGVLLTVIVKILMGVEMGAIVPQLSVFAIAAFRLLPSANRMSGFYNQIVFYLPSINLIYRDLKESEEENKKFHEEENEKDQLTLDQDIRVRDLSFRYEENMRWILKDINLWIPLGKSTAFIGPSGAGKTTMADILLGLLTADKGEITIGKADISDHLKSWSEIIGYIPQTIYLSDGTIRSNVAFGIKKDKICEEQVWTALEDAQLAEFVRSLKNGLDTEIGERGVRLSGGQRQRIGIARALYTNPQFLVLDEATSALDGETEDAVMEAIEQLHGKKTMLIIAHRLSTIKNCDIVYQIKDGKVQLMDKSNLANQ